MSNKKKTYLNTLKKDTIYFIDKFVAKMSEINSIYFNDGWSKLITNSTSFCSINYIQGLNKQEMTNIT